LTPAVAEVLEECQAAGVKVAIVLSAGFGESGSAGVDRERQIRQRLRQGSMRVVGANSFGIACPHTGFTTPPWRPPWSPPARLAFLAKAAPF
jgi:acetyltransferase